ncbi:MAG TPA: hypothetical protein VM939_14930, partial [Gemmatimonadaceae bacterium]|nr:hypothetical protein [Gemmatimonadaceae bacterium]
MSIAETPETPVTPSDPAGSGEPAADGSDAIAPESSTGLSTESVSDDAIAGDADSAAVTDPGVVGEAAPAAAPPAPQARAKTKGVADVVFLVDVSGSMSTCIDALRRNIEAFIDSLSSGDANNAAPVKDWRGKVVGYRDIEAAQSEGIEW